MTPNFRWRMVPFAITLFLGVSVFAVGVLYSLQVGIPEVRRLYSEGYPQSALKFALIPMSFFVVAGLLCIVSWFTIRAKYELATYFAISLPIYLLFAYYFVYSI